MQKAPVGAFCIIFDLLYVTNSPDRPDSALDGSVTLEDFFCGQLILVVPVKWSQCLSKVYCSQFIKHFHSYTGYVWTCSEEHVDCSGDCRRFFLEFGILWMFMDSVCKINFCPLGTVQTTTGSVPQCTLSECRILLNPFSAGTAFMLMQTG